MTRLKAALNLIKRGNIFFCNNHEVSEIVVQWPYQFVKVRQSRNVFFSIRRFFQKTNERIRFFGLTVLTPPIAEILCVKNGRAIVVCGFLMK